MHGYFFKKSTSHCFWRLVKIRSNWFIKQCFIILIPYLVLSMIKILNKGHTFQAKLNGYSKQTKASNMIKYEINTHTFLQYKQCCLVQNGHAHLFLEEKKNIVLSKYSKNTPSMHCGVLRATVCCNITVHWKLVI